MHSYLGLTWNLLFLISSISVFCASISKLEKNILNVLNSNTTTGSIATTQSNAISTGPGAYAVVHGLVSSGTSSQLQSQSSSDTDTSLTSSIQNLNCSDYSDAYSAGGFSADSIASGNCTTHNGNELLNENQAVAGKFKQNGNNFAETDQVININMAPPPSTRLN